MAISESTWLSYNTHLRSDVLADTMGSDAESIPVGGCILYQGMESVITQNRDKLR